MAKKKTPAKGAQQTGRPAQPSWRKPPAQSRRQIRDQKSRSQRSSTRRLPSQLVPPAPQAAARNLVKPRDDSERAADVLRRDWRTLLRQGFLLILLGAVIFSLVQVFQLPALAVTDTAAQIGGARRLSPREIYDASGVQGRNIFLIQPSEIETNVRSVPGIADARVHLRLPNQVMIDVQEHAPLVAWHSITETVWLAADGATVPQTGALPPLTLTDTTGASLAASEARRREVLAHLTRLHAGYTDLVEFVYGDPQGLYYRTPNGLEVWLGDTGPMTEKVALVAGAEQEITAAGLQAKVIDLRFSDERVLWW